MNIANEQDISHCYVLYVGWKNIFFSVRYCVSHD